MPAFLLCAVLIASGPQEEGRYSTLREFGRQSVSMTFITVYGWDYSIIASLMLCNLEMKPHYLCMCGLNCYLCRGGFSLV